MGKTVIIILLLVIVAGGGFLYITIRRKLRMISRLAFGTDSLIEGIRSQEDRLATTPKSVSGMTSLCLPQIQRDFPEFSLAELIQRSENQLKASLAAVEMQDISRLQQASEDLRSQIGLWIEDDKRRGIREHFQKITVHRTEISRYQKREGCCVITLQSAVGYEYWEEWLKEWQIQKAGHGEKENTPLEERRMRQTRYNMEFMYIQDREKLQSGQTAMAVTCPQCGAPISRLGSKFCEYCGSGIEPINIRVWSLNRIQEG